MTATKAVAGGVAANIVTIILWAISSIPGWSAVPEQPRAAIFALVSAGVGAAIVYFAPANKETLAAASAGRHGELVGLPGMGRTSRRNNGLSMSPKEERRELTRESR